jgi:hypothetical protein
MKGIYFLLLFFLFSAVEIVFAHGPGSVSFLKLDDKPTETYFLEDVGVVSDKLVVPRDTAPNDYIVNEGIEFTIDIHKLEEQYSQPANTFTFFWDFGDETKAEGPEQKHTYKKSGSYILNITSNKEEISENVLIHILPKKDYTLPKASVKVNDTKGTRENYNILDFDLNKSLTFDASESVSSSSKIVKYTWDFGDGKSAVGKIVKHQYQLPQAFATVVLRVEDENGLIADAFVNVRNSGSNEPNNLQAAGISRIVGPVLIAVIAAIVGMCLKLRRKKKRARGT